MHCHVAAKLIDKRSPSCAVGVALGTVDAMREFDKGHYRKGRGLLSTS
jgi:hypothetical protein